MNLFELFVKIGVDDQASGNLEKIGKKLGNGLKTAAKIGTAAVGVAAAGITALTKSAIDNYAEYEQLVGGVETLFNESADRVKQYANEAYKSAGLSANEYMSTVTGFSASLLQSLGRGAQTDLDALKENLDEQYDATKKSWQDRIKLAKKLKQNNVAELEAQMDAELKALKKGNEQKLAEAETANNKSVVTAETQALAADLANQAVIDMADNAAKMGTSMELIQNAYAGFAKQNYTMLDNLKLGYGGTQSEMQRLVKHAAEVDKSIDANSLSFDNIVKAINVVQTEMGITGTTALEAGRTISGSVGAMKSAWTNLVTGFADGNADIEGLINNLVTTIVGDGTENNLGVIGNVLPAVETALGGIAKLIEGAAPKIIEILPGLVERVVPSVISAATGMVDAVVKVVPDLLKAVVDALVKEAPELIKAAVELVKSLVTGIKDNYQILVDGAITIVEELVKGVVDLLPEIIKLGLDLIVSLANGIATSLPTLIPKIVDVILQIVDTLTSPEQLTTILNAALTLITELAYGLMNAIPQLVDACFTIIENLVDFLIDPTNIGMLMKAALDIIIAIGTGLISSIPRLIEYWKKVPSSIIENFKETDWGKLGNDLVDGFKNGISKAWTNLKKWFKGLFGDLIGIAKKILGIASPSKVFKKIGGFTAEGFGAGFDDEFAHVKDDMEDALNFDDASVGINASIRKVGAGAAGGAFGGTSIGNININIDGAKYSDEQSLASAIALEIQNMTDRRAAVYA